MSAHPSSHSQALALTTVTLLRLLTLIVGVAMIGLASIGIATLYTQLQQVCSAPMEVCAQTFQLVPGNLAGVNDPASALLFHSIWRASLNLIGRLTCWMLAFLILRHRSRDLMGLITALWLLTYGAPFDLFATASVYPWLLVPVLGLFALNDICFGLFLVLFPRGQFQPRWSFGVAALWVLYTLMNLFSLQNLLDQSRELVIIGVLYSSTLLLQVYRYRKLSSITERKQTKWVVLGLLVWWGVSLLTRWIVATAFVPTSPITPMYYLTGIGFPVSGLVLPITVSIAILNHGLFDIDLVINRALVYSALTAFVVGTYMLIVVGVGALLRVQDSVPLSLLATGFVAIAFNPLRERLQRGANRLLYGQRDEPYAVVAHLGKQLESGQAGSEVLYVIAQTIGQTLKLSHVWLETQDERRWQAEYREPSVKFPTQGVERWITFPLSYGAEQIGVLKVTSRVGERLNSADHALLQNLARQAGIAVHAAQATADLQISRERIVTAREEERRRIRRDLHDGLGPQLASQSLKLETARDLIPDQPMHAQTMLNELISLSQKMLADIRRLVYALRPPALDDFGLVGALHEIAARIAPPTLRIEFRVPDVLPPLPAALEVAVYRITQEALTNVVKHAQATQCTVLVALATRFKQQDTFTLEFHDDGLGIATDAHSGVGMHSMRERAEELGGTLIITPNQPRGTVILVALPIVTP